MKEELGEIKKELMFSLITEKDTAELIERIYSKGYGAGVRDQRRLNMRLKFKYGILLNWIDEQLSSFSNYTLRSEYKECIDGINELKDVYLSENNLHASYKPAKAFEIEVDGEKITFDIRKDLGYLLVPVIDDFVKAEDSRLAAAKLKKEEKEKASVETNKSTNE